MVRLFLLSILFCTTLQSVNALVDNWEDYYSYYDNNYIESVIKYFFKEQDNPNMRGTEKCTLLNRYRIPVDCDKTDDDNYYEYEYTYENDEYPDELIV